MARNASGGKVRSYWLQEALAREPAQPEPLDGDLKADVCIVGGGFTGLWTALRIKELDPAAEVVIVERDICGGGASGRNGGMMLTWSSKAPVLLGLCGAQETARLIRESETTVGAIGRFCAEQGIDVQFRQDGWLWTATSRAQLDGWRCALEVLDRLGLHPFEELSRQETARRTHSDRHIAGVFEATPATVQPALLARGLRRVCLAKGVRIHEATPVTRLERTHHPVVHTPRGRIRAAKVVLALNAWAHELPEFRRLVVPICADILVSEPIPERLAEMDWRDGVGISDSRMMLDYYRTTVGGRIAYGKGGGPVPFAGRVGDRFDDPSPRRDEIRAAMLRNYPDLADVKIAMSWRGPATRTATGVPMFGRHPATPAIVYGHGYIGNGVGPSYNGGKILASLVLGRDDEWSSCPLVDSKGPAFPPEPFRYLGSKVIRAAVKAKDAAEDRDEKPGLVVRGLASLAPAGMTVRSQDEA
ncbi:MAG: FAD-dependent oxidoreductase [Kiloniellales bacterium]